MDLTSQAAAALMTFLKSDRQLGNRKLQALNPSSYRKVSHRLQNKGRLHSSIT
ncbi:hypothetical protein OAG99_00885 [Akkermansiaceae bacterium]|nr:hypothetical protein [Akkermansiaceae bacterium]